MIELPPFNLTYEPAMRGPRGKRETYYKVHVTDIHRYPWLRIDLHVLRTAAGQDIEHFEVERVFFRQAPDYRWGRCGSLDSVLLDRELWEQIMDAIAHRMMQARIWGDEDLDEVYLGYLWGDAKEIRDIEFGRWESPLYSDEAFAMTTDVMMEEIATYLASDPRPPVTRRRPNPPKVADGDAAETNRAPFRFYFETLLDELQSWNRESTEEEEEGDDH